MLESCYFWSASESKGDVIYEEHEKGYRKVHFLVNNFRYCIVYQWLIMLTLRFVYRKDRGECISKGWNFLTYDMYQNKAFRWTVSRKISRIFLYFPTFVVVLQTILRFEKFRSLCFIDNALSETKLFINRVSQTYSWVWWIHSLVKFSRTFCKLYSKRRRKCFIFEGAVHE